MKPGCFFYICLTLGLCSAADGHAADAPPPKETANGESDTDSDRDTASGDTENGGITYLPPPPPSDAVPPAKTDEAPSICDRIPCSGHGICVVKSGEPICACYEGFVPDSAGGLNCIREQSPPPPPPPVARPPRAPAWNKETYYLNLSIALGDYDIRPARKQYEAALKNRTAEGSFAAYLRGRFKRTQNFGTLSMSIGIPALAGGLAMHMLYAGYPEKKGLLAGAVILDLSSALLIGTGAALLATSAIHIKKLEAFERKHRRGRPRASIQPPMLGFTRNAALLCFGAHFF